MRIFLLTGAGVSAESGLGTFRDKGGLWTRFDLNEVATPQGYARDPDKVLAFYSMRRENHGDAEPNAAHFAVARLEQELAARGWRLFLCTQNVDNLHERGGARAVHHMHGQVFRTRCGHCRVIFDDAAPLTQDRACPECGRAGLLRPDVVWFGETPLGLDMIDEELSQADLFVSLGTSGSVYPAAGLVSQARSWGIRTCELNLEPSQNAFAFDERRYGPATEIVPAWVEEVLRG
ncbi:NAD-dependent deacylase [Caulobacter sp. NIBR2454]|uniref:NAD-dependent deacylase n=1 Tax=Caulobacter sp. NIBR2454 TaxID=3015996 RepID=UPI003FA47E5D